MPTAAMTGAQQLPDTCTSSHILTTAVGNSERMHHCRADHRAEAEAPRCQYRKINVQHSL